MKVYLIRHGKTKGNLEKRYVGITDEPVLPEEKDRLKKLRYPRVDAIYSSPRRRCLETAVLIFPGQKVKLVEELTECDFGDFEYKNYKELEGNEDYQRWIDSGGTIGFPGGEDRETFRNRCRRAYRQIIQDAEQKGYESIAMVVHGGTIMALMECMTHPGDDYYFWMTENGSGFVLDSDSGAWKVIKGM